MFLLSKIIITVCYVMSCHFSAVACVMISQGLPESHQMIAAMGGALFCWIVLTVVFYFTGGFSNDN
jgi:uncharacterized membrane protein